MPAACCRAGCRRRSTRRAGRSREQLAARLAAFEPRIRRLVSSDLVRARQTAEPIAATLGIAPIYDARWRERGLGEMEGQTIGERETWRAATGDVDPVGAEAVADFQARAAAALRSLYDRFAAESTVAVVTHGGTIRSILRLFASGRLPLAGGLADAADVQMIANCSILQLVAERPGSGQEPVWRIACINDVAHLSDDEVTNRDAG
jgi:probable phosphoglycerate mutase